MKYSPSYLVFTPSERKITFTIEGEGISRFDLKQTKVLAITLEKGTLHEEICSAVTTPMFSSLSTSGSKALITFEITNEISEKLKGCISSKNQYLALSLDIPTQTVNGKVTTQQRALIPLFDNSQQNILTKKRTAEVLGELTKNLVIKDLECNPNLLVIREDITCRTEITNATDTAVLTNIITAVREGLPPGLTLVENIQRTNILLLPGQSYSLTFQVPKEVYHTLNNKVSVLSSFSSIGTENANFTTYKQNTIWLFPPLFIAITCGILLLISAILFRKKMIKFIPSQHGAQKANV